MSAPQGPIPAKKQLHTVKIMLKALIYCAGLIVKVSYEPICDGSAQTAPGC